MKEEILSYLPAECPWRDTLHWYDTIDSTNTRAKELARRGAPHGTILIAGSQTDGRGRKGRSFTSPQGMGVYLSVILRPQCAPAALMHLTCAAAVAMCDAIEHIAGFRPGVKWTNDLVFGKRKLGGILTELAPDLKTGLTDFAIIGIGINCRQTDADFPPELRSIATSLSAVSGQDVTPSRLAASMIQALVKMDRLLLTEKAQIMAHYRTDCMTLNQDIVLLQGDRKRYGTAIDLDEDGGLIVRFADGTVRTVTSGEVSVRGMYGYV